MGEKDRNKALNKPSTAAPEAIPEARADVVAKSEADLKTHSEVTAQRTMPGEKPEDISAEIQKAYGESVDKEKDLKKGQKEIWGMINKKTKHLLIDEKGRKVDHMEFARVYVRGKVYKAYDELGREWRARRKALWRDKKGPAEYDKLDEEMLARTTRLTDFLRRHVEQMSEMSDLKRFTEATFDKMQKSMSVIKGVMDPGKEAFKGFEDLRLAVYEVIGETKYRINDKKPEVNQILSKYLNLRNAPAGLTEALWGVIVIEMSKAQQEDLFIYHTREMPYEELKKFVDDTAVKGIPWSILKNVIEARRDLTVEQKKYFHDRKERYQAAYEVTEKVFLERARFLRSQSDTNPALRMLTGPNILRFAAQCGAVLTISANVLANMFYKGQWHKNPIEVIGKLVRNVPFLGATGIFAATYRRKRSPYSTDKMEASLQMAETFELDSKLGYFFNDKEHGYQGAKALAGYIEYLRVRDGKKGSAGKLRPERASIDADTNGFLPWLTRESKKDPTKYPASLVDRARSLKGVDAELFKKVVWTFGLYELSEDTVGRDLPLILEDIRTGKRVELAGKTQT